MAEAFVDTGTERVRISSPDKVVFPDKGWTKLDVAEHFAMCGEGAIRNVYNRPTMLKRWTNDRRFLLAANPSSAGFSSPKTHLVCGPMFS